MVQLEQALKLDTLSYIDNLHSNSKGWITRSIINNKGYRQWHYKYTELTNLDLTGENNYISLNTFYKPQRRLENIKELNALYIDLDYYNTNKTQSQILMDLEQNYFNQLIPLPNYIVDSGRGMYLIWLINKVPSQALPLWKAIEEYFYNQLKDFGADRQALDATRILRVPGSINSKSKTVVTVLDEYKYVYDLREIQNEYLPELRSRTSKKQKTNKPYKKINFIFRERSLYYARLQDLTKLCELRHYDVVGYRELILFLYRYYLCYFTEDTEKALQDTLELNKQFITPLGQNEVVRATKSAEKCYLTQDKQYKYKNDTLIELLGITDDEQAKLSTIISKVEYRNRDREYHKKVDKKKYQEKLKSQGKLTEKDKISQRRQKIKALLQQGFKQKDICLTLAISKDTYIRDRKYFKEQGLI